jgi:hypothetical protein
MAIASRMVKVSHGSSYNEARLQVPKLDRIFRYPSFPNECNDSAFNISSGTIDIHYAPPRIATPLRGACIYADGLGMTLPLSVS